MPEGSHFRPGRQACKLLAAGLLQRHERLKDRLGQAQGEGFSQTLRAVTDGFCRDADGANLLCQPEAQRLPGQNERVDCESFAPGDRARRQAQLIDAPKQLGSEGRWLSSHLFDRYSPFLVADALGSLFPKSAAR